MTSSNQKPPDRWISARHVQHMVAHGQAAGIKVDQLLGEAGVGQLRTIDSDASVPIASIEAALALINDRHPDPLLGLNLTRTIQPATFGAIGYILQACTTFSDVLHTLTRYDGLLSNIGHTQVTYAPGLVHLQWECKAGSALFRRHATEYVLGSFVVLARLLLPEKAKQIPLAVHFSHAAPERPEIARAYFNFFKCPVYFSKPVNAMLISSELLNAKMHHGDAFMRNLLERHAESQLKQRQQASSLSLKEEAKHLVAAMILDGVPTKEMLAAQLGMSSRNLHRRLQDQDSSYRAIVDEVRLELAQKYLRETQDSLSQLADRLGFHSHQAFMRWYKNLTGMTPGSYRSKQ